MARVEKVAGAGLEGHLAVNAVAKEERAMGKLEEVEMVEAEEERGLVVAVVMVEMEVARAARAEAANAVELAGMVKVGWLGAQVGCVEVGVVLPRTPPQSYQQLQHRRMR